MRRSYQNTVLLITALLLALIAHAQTPQHNWDRTSSGQCSQPTQCLVSNANNPAFDNQPDRYWSQNEPANKPKCIANRQYIADHYCDNGEWSSRTKLIAEQLLSIALQQSPNDYALACDRPELVLNRYTYPTSYGPAVSFLKRFCLMPGSQTVGNCANNACVLRYGQNVAIGLSSNTDISGDKSPLHALNQSSTLCDNAKNTDNDYDACGSNTWYNHDTESIIHAPGLSNMPAPRSRAAELITQPYDTIKDYALTVVQQPNIPQIDYSFFAITPHFNQLLIAQRDRARVYAVKQDDMTPAQTDYAGWQFSDIEMPPNTCTRFIKRYDQRALCEQQPSQDEFLIAAYSTATTPGRNLVAIWRDLAQVTP